MTLTRIGSWDWAEEDMCVCTCWRALPGPFLGSRTAQNTSILGCGGSPAGKHIFGPSLTPFRSQSGASQGVWGPTGASEWPQTASKRARNACLSTQVVQGHLWKTRFWLFSDPLSVPKWAIGRPCLKAKPCLKPVQTGVQNARKRVFEHPQWSRVIFGNSISALLGPILGPSGVVWAKPHHLWEGKKLNLFSTFRVRNCFQPAKPVPVPN